MAKSANVPIPGYLYSMVLERLGAGKKDKPKWQSDVYAAITDDRVYPRGCGTMKERVQEIRIEVN